MNEGMTGTGGWLTSKVCKSCGDRLPHRQFRKNGRRVDGSAKRSNSCKPCDAILDRARAARKRAE